MIMNLAPDPDLLTSFCGMIHREACLSEEKLPQICVGQVPRSVASVCIALLPCWLLPRERDLYAKQRGALAENHFVFRSGGRAIQSGTLARAAVPHGDVTVVRFGAPEGRITLRYAAEVLCSPRFLPDW